MKLIVTKEPVGLGRQALSDKKLKLNFGGREPQECSECGNQGKNVTFTEKVTRLFASLNMKIDAVGQFGGKTIEKLPLSATGLEFERSPAERKGSIPFTAYVIGRLFLELIRQ